MFRFRPITRADFPRVSLWLRQPHVARWWADDASLEGLEAAYGPNIDGTDQAEVFIAELDGMPAGLVQRYRIDAYPRYVTEIEAVVPVPKDAYSIDYLLGEAQLTGRGLGAAMIAAFVEALWRDRVDARAIVVPIHALNVASGRALARNGFELMARGELDPDNPADSRDHLIYALSRVSATR